MNTPQTPDYGEPWQVISPTRTVRDRHDQIVSSDEAHSRMLECVNACAGMADPAAEIQVMREVVNTLRWIPITERLPTIEDGNKFEDVEWSDGYDIWQDNYSLVPSLYKATHWRRITLP